jgi:ribosomal protein L31
LMIKLGFKCFFIHIVIANLAMVEHSTNGSTLGANVRIIRLKRRQASLNLNIIFRPNSHPKYTGAEKHHWNNIPKGLI